MRRGRAQQISPAGQQWDHFCWGLHHEQSDFCGAEMADSSSELIKAISGSCSKFPHHHSIAHSLKSPRTQASSKKELWCHLRRVFIHLRNLGLMVPGLHWTIWAFRCCIKFDGQYLEQYHRFVGSLYRLPIDDVLRMLFYQIYPNLQWFTKFEPSKIASGPWKWISTWIRCLTIFKTIGDALSSSFQNSQYNTC
jgi:hypothetical protein